MTNETKTQTLGEFLADYAACRVWKASVGCPTGTELVINLDDDDDDYCDAESLLDFIPGGAEDITGTVTQDTNGEWRWEPETLEGTDLRDSRQNTIYKLVVWAM